MLIESQTGEEPIQILKYNMDTQKIQDSFECPSAKYICCTGSIDRENGVIYLMGLGVMFNALNTYQNIFMSFNINSNQWKLLRYTNWETRQPPITFENCYFIPSPISQLHITCLGHYKYDASNDKLIKFNNDTSLISKPIPNTSSVQKQLQAKFIYHKSSQQLMFEPKVIVFVFVIMM